ncbi:BRO-N domain-containing protein [Aliivibrio salmonicida]|uniref:BRO-N domain-containing protein n=1 Tax=Aliivibrio salmonicida TaxID=40269 RepID=UPI003D127FB1
MFDVLLYPSSLGELEIKTMQKNGETLFLLPDVVRVISKESQHIDGKSTSNQTSFLRACLSSLEEDECFVELFNENGIEKSEYFVSEPGVYRVALQSNSSGAKKFQNWVIKEVMPSIRKYGMYPPPEVSDDDLLLQLADQQAKQSLLLSQFIRSSKEKFDNLDNKVVKQSNKIEQQNTKIQSLGERLITVESSNLPKYEFFDIADVLRSLSIDLKELNFVIALCEKIASEKGYNFLPSFNKVREEQRFSMPTIELALTYARLSSSQGENA